jgi:hypothetical protein
MTWNLMCLNGCTRTFACLLVCWTYFFDPEDGGDMFLRNVGWNSTDYTAHIPDDDTLQHLEKLIIAQSWNSSPFTEYESLLLCSQQPATRPYPISLRYILILSSHLCQGLQSVFFPSGITTFCVNFLSHLFVLHCASHLIMRWFQIFFKTFTTICTSLHTKRAINM